MTYPEWRPQKPSRTGALPSENSPGRATASPSASPPNGSTSTSTEPSPTSPSPPPATERSAYDRSYPKGEPDPLVSLTLDVIRCPEPHNGRLETNENHIRALARNIADHGLLTPILVRAADDHYDLIAGRNRLSAMKLLGAQTIRCFVTNREPHQCAVLRLSENTARSQLTPIEEAIQLLKILNEGHHDVTSLADTLGRSERWLLDRLDIAAWDPELQDAVHTKKVPLTAARFLCKIESETDRKFLIGQAILHGINAATARAWLQNSQTLQAPPTNSSDSGSTQAPPDFLTDVKCRCFMCTEYKPITETSSKSVCHTCLELLQKACNGPPQPEPQPQPPATAEPPTHATTPDTRSEPPLERP